MIHGIPLTPDTLPFVLFAIAFLAFAGLWLAPAALSTFAAVVRSGQISEAERDAEGDHLTP